MSWQPFWISQQITFISNYNFSCYPDTSLKVSVNMPYGSGGGFKNVKTDNESTESNRMDKGKQAIP